MGAPLAFNTNEMSEWKIPEWYLKHKDANTIEERHKRDIALIRFVWRQSRNWKLPDSQAEQLLKEFEDEMD